MEDVDNEAEEAKFDADPPPDAGPFRFSLPDGIISNPMMSFDWPEADLVMTLGIESKNYGVYQKIKYSASLKQQYGGKPYVAKRFVLNMNSGQGFFSKSKKDTSKIVYTEEKYGKLGFGSDIHMDAEATLQTGEVIKRTYG